MPSRETQRAWAGTRGGPDPQEHGRHDPLERRIRLPRSSTSAAQPEDSGGNAGRPHRPRGDATNRNSSPTLQKASSECASTSWWSAAGAYMSPAILQRSGIGPEEELAGLGVPVVAPLPGRSRPESSADDPSACVTFAPMSKLEATTPGVLEKVMLKARSSLCRDGYWDTHVLAGPLDLLGRKSARRHIRDLGRGGGLRGSGQTPHMRCGSAARARAAVRRPERP